MTHLEMMVVLVVSVVVALLVVPYLWKVMQGPTVFDRVVAFNAIGTKVPVLLLLTGLIYGHLEMLVDLAIALFLLNMVTTLLISRYMRVRKDRGGNA